VFCIRCQNLLCKMMLWGSLNPCLSRSVRAQESFKEGQIDALINKIREHLGEDIEVDFRIVNKIGPSKSGKYRFAISKVGHSLT